MEQVSLRSEGGAHPDAERRRLGFSGDGQPTLRLDNWRCIEAAFGTDAANQARRHAAAVLEHYLDSPDAIASANGEWLDIRLPATLLQHGGTPEAAWRRVLPGLCADLASRAFDWNGARIHVVPSGHFLPLDDGDQARAIMAAARSGDAKARQYRADMAKAAALLARIANEESLLAWQAVGHFADPARTLYHEALLHAVDDKAARPLIPAEALQALGHVGLFPLFDLHLASRILDELDAAPSSVALGIGISEQCIAAEHWVAEIERRLRAKPDLARRLILELSETAPTSISRTISFADRMHELGCRIALKGFGTGISSIRGMLALPADIVKLDGYFLRRANQSPRDRQIFLGVVDLARAATDVVVAEGVEGNEQYELAREAGVEWLQGNWLKPPSLIRPWIGRGR